MRPAPPIGLTHGLSSALMAHYHPPPTSGHLLNAQCPPIGPDTSLHPSLPNPNQLLSTPPPKVRGPPVAAAMMRGASEPPSSTASWLQHSRTALLRVLGSGSAHGGGHNRVEFMLARSGTAERGGLGRGLRMGEHGSAALRVVQTCRGQGLRMDWGMAGLGFKQRARAC